MPISTINTNSIADDAVTVPKVADQVLTHRNLIINGAMQVAQRGTSVSSLSSGSSYQTSDRWNTQFGSAGTFTQSQSTTAPDGFTTSLKLDCTAANASPSYLLIVQRIEGQNLQHLQKGSSGAKSLTLSFYVRSSKTGTYQVNLTDSDNSRNIGATYTISTADTWEYKAITFAGDTTGTFDNDNGLSLQVEWWLAAGSTYNSGSVPTSWEAQSSGDRAAGLTVNIGASTSDDFYLTGVQLELGEQATPFEHRSYGEELSLCQRYYEKCGTGIVGGTSSNTTAWNSGIAFKVEKRATPSVIHLANFTAITPGSNTHTVSVSTMQYSTTWGACLTHTATGSAGSNQCWLYFESSNNIAFDAEL